MIADVLELEVENDIRVHSLAFDAVDEKKVQHKVATLSFHFRPALLSESSKDWDFGLPNDNKDDCNGEPQGHRIHIDEHFDVFTPLSPAEVPERHTIEYEYHES